MEKLNSETLKQEILELFLWERNFLLGTTEYNNGYGIADVFSISKTMFSWEIEVKVSKQDLLGELNAIELSKTKDINFFKDKKYAINKYIKHESYLSQFNNHKGKGEAMYNIPNYFLFFIPVELQDTAINILEGTPYGLYIYDKNSKLKKKQIQCIKKPVKIHKSKTKEKYIFELAKRLSSENLSIRKKYIK